MPSRPDLTAPRVADSLSTFSTAASRSLKILPPGRLARAAFVTVLAATCDVSSARMMAADGEPFFTVVVLPDTQYYAAEYPQILEAQTQWIVHRRDPEHIALVVHEGDVVDADEPRQWGAAAHSLHELDGVVPYVLAAGNHDYQRAGSRVSRETSISAYFPPSGLSATDWFGGTFEAGRIENSYAIVSTPGTRWLVLALEFGPRDAVLAWADAVLRRYPALPAIVVTHAYLYSDGTRYDHRTRPDQLWNPHQYLAEEHPGDVNDGQEIWRKLVSRNSNVRFVLCGHDLADGVGRLTSVRPDGTTVHELLANYQASALGGEGFLRLMRFFPAQRRVAVRTYSPYSDRFKTDTDNEFTLSY